jgi:hypothetical protein
MHSVNAFRRTGAPVHPWVYPCRPVTPYELLMGILVWDGATLALASWSKRRARRRRAAEPPAPAEPSIADEAQEWLFWREHLDQG